MNETREKPILFSGPMVRAILAGRKTVTRRLVTVPIPDGADEVFLWQPSPETVAAGIKSAQAGLWARRNDGCEPEDGWIRWLAPPYALPGCRLWVRETIRRGSFQASGRDTAYYAADGAKTALDSWPWERAILPSIHCPRGLSRISLEVTGLRVERLQSIMEEDAKAEGAFFTDYGRLCHHAWGGPSPCPAPDAHHPRRNGWAMWPTQSADECLGSARMAFANAWNVINGKRAPWESNPWVWRVEFRWVTP